MRILIGSLDVGVRAHRELPRALDFHLGRVGMVLELSLANGWLPTLRRNNAKGRTLAWLFMRIWWCSKRWPDDA